MPVPKRQQAFTLIELLMVIATIAILASILLPVVAKGPARARQTKCLSNLRQVGVGFLTWAHDHEGHLPMELSVTNGGTWEYLRTPQAFRHVAVLSDILATPSIVICPEDTREPATSWLTLRNRNLSYLIGIEAKTDKPMSLLAADRNIRKVPSTGGVQVIINSQASWTEEIHNRKGNALLADGSAHQFDDRRLREALTGNIRVGN
jgi:prepilin-type N-terminal cleavage/methylation domain-containing protein/prepilin-type processing-associated H-X9-DG protein